MYDEYDCSNTVWILLKICLMVVIRSVTIITTCCCMINRFLPGQVPLLRVNKKVLDSQKLIVGDYEVLVWHFPSLTVFCPRALAICSFRVCSGRRLAHLNGDICDLKRCDGELQEQPTFFLHLALDIRVIDDFAQGDAAEQ